ncbi:MAG: MarC family protein [Gemmatimonadales bacterium]
MELLLVFTSVLFIVDPFAVVPSFLAMTERDTPAFRRVLAKRGAWTAGVTSALFALGGSVIFTLFGITIIKLTGLVGAGRP